MQIAFIKCHGSGNDFALIDARDLTLAAEEWAMLARLLSDRAGPVGGDGILLLGRGDDAGAAFSMRMLNPDGSEAETCLNGLRCTARLGFEVTGLAKARVALATSMAEAEQIAPLAPGVATIRTRAGPASTLPGDVGIALDAPVVDARVPGLPSERRVTAIAMPNPHLVSFVDRIDESELTALGDWCEAAPALLPARANVSFVEMRGDDALFVRTYERGVGLTHACGSAMAASVFAAGLTGRIGFGREVRVFNRGGMVLASASAPDAGATVTIAGNATFLYDASVTFDPQAGTIDVPMIHARRFDEARSWEALVATLG